MHILADPLTVNKLPPTDADEQTCTIIDAMAVIQAIGSKTNAKTFREFVDQVTDSMFKHLSYSCNRVDIVFDCYSELSTKACTRDERSRGVRRIRRIVDSRSVEMPKLWSQFNGMEAKKVNLIHFLSKELLLKAENLPGHIEVIVAGGGEDPTKVTSSKGRDAQHLFSSQEEADTRMILHASEAHQMGYHRAVVISKDTDVFVLLIYHETTPEVQMMGGT